MSRAVENIMTVDVEEWFHILDVVGSHPRRDWPGLESRVVGNTERILEIFEASGTRATFFVVGWVAERHPKLIRRIAESGQEVASHSYWHELLRHHDRASLMADLGRSKHILQELTGQPIRGFRAPGGSMTPETVWAFDVLVELGFAYDASMCPGHSSHGGFASPYTDPHALRCRSGTLVEIPSSTLGVGSARVPYAGGGYLRLFPQRLVEAAVDRGNRRGRPTSVYVHPREVDPDQPRMKLPPLRRFKYYVGLSSMERKLRALLEGRRFVSAWDWIEGHGASLAGRELDVRALASRAHPAPDPARIPPPPPIDTTVAIDLSARGSRPASVPETAARRFSGPRDTAR